MPTTIGSLADVPAPGDAITSPWAQDVTRLAVHSFANKAALDAWSTAPVGAAAITLDNFRRYTRRATAWAPDFDGQTLAVTFSAGAATVNHQLGRVPIVVVVTPSANIALMIGVVSPTATNFGLWGRDHAGATFTGTTSIYYWVV